VLITWFYGAEGTANFFLLTDPAALLCFAEF
jgi:hypothetical protein